MSAADVLPNWSGAGVLVTGGAAGIGLSLGRAAARRGAKIVLSDIEADVAEKAAAGLQDEGLDASSLRCDVTDPDEVAASIEETVARLGSLNLLCANAGVGASNPITDMSLQEFNWIMQVNLFGVVHAVHGAVPALRSAAAAGGLAHVLVTGSENSLGLPEYVGRMTAYQTSKHALLGFTDCIRRDLKEFGVGATLLCPSYVATEGWDAARNRPDRFGGPVHADPANRAMLHQLGQDPEEVAALALAGVDAGAEIVVTSERSRECADVRMAEVDAAFQRLSASLASQS